MYQKLWLHVNAADLPDQEYTKMYYFKNVTDVCLLEAELKKLKSAYAEHLKKPDASASIKDIRRLIKALTGRINILKTGEVLHQ